MINGETISSKIISGLTNLKETTMDFPSFIKAHGSDWTAWPKTSNWYKAFSNFNSASNDALSLDKHLTAEFKVL